MATLYSSPTGDFVTSSLIGAITSASTSATIGSSLTLPATNGILQVDYDSILALGVDSGPETILYASYNSSTGALTGITRAQAGTTAVAHANTATVQSGPSVLYFSLTDLKSIIEQTVWTAYTPTYGGSGSQTWGTVTTTTARYMVLGKTMFLQVTATGTVGGTPSDGLTFTLPGGFTTKASATNIGGPCGVVDNGGRKGGHWYNSTTSVIQCDRYDSGNFSAGSGGVNYDAVIEIA